MGISYNNGSGTITYFGVLLYNEGDGERWRVNNYEKNYENIRPWLGKLSKPHEVDFLGRRWHIDRRGVEQLSGRPADINCKSVLVWYFTYGGEGEPSYEFTPIHSFSNGIFSMGDWGIKAPSSLEKFRETAATLGASFLRKERYGEAWLLLALPKIPVRLMYSESDDEFPALLDIKFGSNAVSFLPFETLAFLHGLIVAEFDENRNNNPRH